MKFIIDESQYTESDYKSLPVSHSQWYKSCMWKHTERHITLLDSQFFPHVILEHTHGFYFGVLSRVVSSPDTPIICAHPVALSRNRVWTLSLRELGQVYIQWSVNWIIVGVNYTICYQKHLLGAKKIANWLFAMTHNAIYFA